MTTISIRGLAIGAGIPKIIAPITGCDETQILAQAAAFAGAPADIAEWRADFYTGAHNIEQTLHLAAELRRVLGDKPLLFAYRSQTDGGCGDMDNEAYTLLNQRIAAGGTVDLVDVEWQRGAELMRGNIAAIHAAGCYAVGSSHDFAATPPQAEIVARLRAMQELGADVLKIAVTPKCAADVLTLMSASLEMKQRYARRLLLTISMGELGKFSRIAAELSGSAMTFGAVGDPSAPGQLPAQELAPLLRLLHNANEA
ncbi:MAG: type I 3-dehydroquinate dehydratase [Bacillota bacterium]|nr:type I 3-dehydroquinate dehydratase [Bacillota bacterium]